jgi:hypothetical protein
VKTPVLRDLLFAVATRAALGSRSPLLQPFLTLGPGIKHDLNLAHVPRLLCTAPDLVLPNDPRKLAAIVGEFLACHLGQALRGLWELRRRPSANCRPSLPWSSS